MVASMAFRWRADGGPHSNVYWSLGPSAVTLEVLSIVTYELHISYVSTL